MTDAPLSPACARAAARCALAVSVLEDLDLELADEGVQVPGPEPVLVDWREIWQAARGATVPGTDVEWADDPAARLRVSALLRLRRVVADLGHDARAVVREHARLLALPSTHDLYPGAGWRHHGVLGGTLDVGIGIVDLVGQRTDVVPLPPTLARELGAVAWMPWLQERAEEAAQILSARLRRDTARPAKADNFGRPRLPEAVLRPVGGVDVLSMLATRALRAELTRSDPSGMRSVAVPMRNRGWYDIARTDPAFVGAAWSATDMINRGLPRAVLVTRDEVGVGVNGPEITIDLRDLDLAPEGPALRAVDRIRRRLRPER